MVAWLWRVFRNDRVIMGGVVHATPAQLTVMMLSLPWPSWVVTKSTGLGKNHGRGTIFFFMQRPA
jgi:hypothetical protein